MSVFALALIPSDNFQTFNLETAAQKIEADLRYAQELALTTSSPCGASFTAQGNYTIYQGAPGTPATNPLTREPFAANLSQHFKNVNFLNTVQVEFDAIGRPVIGGGSTIQIGSGLTTATLLITPNTGVISRQ